MIHPANIFKAKAKFLKVGDKVTFNSGYSFVIRDLAFKENPDRVCLYHGQERSLIAFAPDDIVCLIPRGRR